MELNIDNRPNDVGVLAPNDQGDEDANRRMENTDAPKTPVARKTRRAVLKRMNATSEKDSPTHPDPPKTPGTPGHIRQSTETPRRSRRKSVRPAIDYDDIIVRSAKKAIAEAIQADLEDEKPAVHKWTTAEVGKNSRKRGRKSKRMVAKKQKIEHIVAEDDEEQVKELEVPQKKVDPSQGAEETTEVQEDILEKVALSTKKSSKKSKTTDPEHSDNIMDIVEKIKQPISIKKSSRASKNPDTKEQKVTEADVDELGICPLDMESQEEDGKDIQGGETKTNAEVVEYEAQKSAVDKDGQKHEEKDEQADEATKPAALDKDKEIAAEDKLKVANAEQAEEEMPSLLMESEDLDEPNQSPLNTTYDAEDKKDLDGSVILVVSPDKQKEASSSDLDASVILVGITDMQPVVCAPKPEIPEEKPVIKVVLTTSDDQDQTLLDLAAVASPNVSQSKKSKGYRFPTPFKARPMFNFTGTEEAVHHDHEVKEGQQQNTRKRSKSASIWNDTMPRTVSFQSPIEIANVEDIDKRWTGLKKSNVNNRRRRSKSLDENRCKMSRIPKPNRGVIPLNKTITPSKVNKRTKMPNFAAMHERQFAKMESLVDHVERKAERAKVLTNSVQKQAPGSTAKKLKSTTSVEDRARPRAMKKIDMTADRTLVMDHPSNKQNSSRLPLKATAPASNVASKPVFNLSTSTVKTFNATFSSRPADSHDNKLAERRQRRIEMFKGRTTKDQKEKGEFIRGVRLNRRFELQMQHRRHSYKFALTCLICRRFVIKYLNFCWFQ